MNNHIPELPKEEISMKKQYETPKAEKIEFNYLNPVVASGERSMGGILKRQSGGNNGCWNGNKNGTTGCTPVYN